MPKPTFYRVSATGVVTTDPIRIVCAIWSKATAEGDIVLRDNNNQHTTTRQAVVGTDLLIWPCPVVFHGLKVVTLGSGTLELEVQHQP